MPKESSFKLTYATMFNPPEELHTNFEAALQKIKSNLGQEYPLLINGEERFTAEKNYEHSPINTDWHLATFQKGTAQDAADAIAAVDRRGTDRSEIEASQSSTNLLPMKPAPRVTNMALR